VTPERPPLPPEVATALHRLDDLVRIVEHHPDEELQELVADMLRAVDLLHRGALRRLSALLDTHDLGSEARDDAHVALLLDLYDEPQDADDDLQIRAAAAVAELRPVVEARGGRLEVDAVESGVVNIRLLGGCASCSGASSSDLRALVEDELRKALPEFTRMDVSDGPPGHEQHGAATPVLIPLSAVGARTAVASAGGGCGAGAHGCSTCG
jgi:Fe-S cluster biogenesis protein NfuA